MDQLILILSLLPSEIVKASELKRGDVAYIHRKWEIVIDTREKINNNDFNLEVNLFRGASYLPSNHDVKILGRHLFDEEKLKAFIDEQLEDVRRMRQEAEQEETEEREREREYLEERLRRLDE